jgi:8-oxo-dGTP pyrophosphatase MutT (NUDIX family)
VKNESLNQLLGALAGTRPPADLPGEARLGVHGDAPPELMPSGPPRSSAVLIPLVERSPEPGILLTRRTDHLPDHPGQICFPGGSLEEADADDVVTAALREMEEEVGIPRHRVGIRGYLPPYLTITGFAVAPVVGLIGPDYRTRPDPHEVAEVFEVPLSHVMDPANHQRLTGKFRGHRLGYYQIDWQSYRIWGATAAMLVGLSELLRSGPRSGTDG